MDPERSEELRDYLPTTSPVANQSHAELIASAYKRTYTAQEKMQAISIMFQRDETISAPQIAELIKQARRSIDGISDLFTHIPTPDYPELHYRFACEERYICEKISLVAAYALRDASIHPSPVFQGAIKECNKIFSGLHNLEHFIHQFQE